MEIKLSDHFNYKRLFRYVFPSIIMMIFTSIYGVVDGFFVSNFVGKTEFAAVNLIMPFPMLLGAVGFMIGTGGSALVSMKLGQERKKEANEIFSMLITVLLISGVVLSVSGLIFIEKIVLLLGATDELIAPCVTYGRILLISLTPFMLQNAFQSFLVTAEKPNFGLGITLIAGCTNIVLDFLMIYVFNLGVVGAALATGISQFVGAIIPVAYFLKGNDCELRLVKSKIDFRLLAKACGNGSSEMMTNVSLSLVNMLYNLQLMKYAGENGVAAYGVIMYVNFIFIAIYVGYAIGTAPIIGYNHGAANKKELKNVYRKSMIFNILSGVLMCVLAILLSGVLSKLFASYDLELYEMTKRGFSLYSISFIFMGINIFSSSFFTALNNGLVSALISFLRTLLFQVVAVITLPLLLALDGIWLSIVAAEALALIVSIAFLITGKKKYGY